MFPEPYPDEDFRSIIYRYHIRSANTTFHKSISDIFGKYSYRNLMFPTNLSLMLDKLPFGHNLDLEYIINNYTWYGLIFSFMDKEKRLNLLNTIINGSNNNILKLRFMPQNLFSKSIRYCPQCIKEDIKNFGECYIHRDHQIEFLDFCPKHLIKLIDKCLICNIPLCKPNADELISLPFCKNEHQLYEQINSIDLDNSGKIKLDLLSMFKIMRDGHSSLNFDYIYSKILMGLWNKGFIHYKGMLFKQKLVHSLLEEFSIEELVGIGLLPDYISRKSYINAIFQPDKVQNNIPFYGLLILFLFKSIDKMIEFNEPMSNPLPFGHGPWRCLNYICEHYNQKIIRDSKVVSKIFGKTHISSEFACPYCGFEYINTWKPKEGMKENVRIKSWGNQLKEKIIELYLDGIPPHKIAKKVRLADSSIRNFLQEVVGTSRMLDENNKQAFVEQLKAYSETSATTIQIDDNKVEKYRHVILDIMKESPSIQRKGIIEKAPSAYFWLKENDKEWFDANLPEKGKHGSPSEIDYPKLDLELKQKIKKLADKLYLEYPYKIYKTTITKHLEPLERIRISIFSDRFPESIAEIERNVEKDQDYLVRGLSRVVENLEKRGYKKITFDKIITIYKPYSNCDEETRKKIEELLNEIY